VKIFLNLKILLLGCILFVVTNNNNGKIENEQINEMINEIIIIIPKSIIGLISVNIKDPNATIVVNDV
tara:strand:+ start:85 stop:288 length:204 start_codon:yes stop_codon:yes gene_type:complete